MISVFVLGTYINFFIKIYKEEFWISSTHPNLFIIPTRQIENNIETIWNQIAQKSSSELCQLDSLMCIVLANENENLN